MEDRDLIKSCLNGNKNSEKELYYRYAGKMLSVCMRYMGGKHRAEDIVQEGFIKVFNSLPKFNFQGSFEGYVRKIMINTALRELGRFRNLKESFGYEYIKEASPDHNIMSQMGADEIMIMISELPEGYRAVFNMYVIDGYSHSEISEKLNIGESTSRSQLVKARKILQAKILKSEKITP